MSTCMNIFIDIWLYSICILQSSYYLTKQSNNNDKPQSSINQRTRLVTTSPTIQTPSNTPPLGGTVGCQRGWWHRSPFARHDASSVSHHETHAEGRRLYLKRNDMKQGKEKDVFPPNKHSIIAMADPHQQKSSANKNRMFCAHKNYITTSQLDHLQRTNKKKAIQLLGQLHYHIYHYIPSLYLVFFGVWDPIEICFETITHPKRETVTNLIQCH